MKNVFVLLMFLGITQCLCFTQEEIRKQNMWVTKDSCVNAYGSNAYIFYQSKDFRNKRKNPANGKDRVVAPTTENYGFEMITTSGRRFVILEAGTMLRWQKQKDNTFMPYAKDDCGNKIFSYFSLTNKPGEMVKKEVPAKKSSAPLFSHFRIPESKNFHRENFHRKEIAEIKSFSPTPYIIGGLIVGGIVYAVLSSRHHNNNDYQNYYSPTPQGPGVITGPAGPGVNTGSATKISPRPIPISVGIRIGF